MRLTLSSAQAQRILEVLNEKLPRGKKAQSFSIQIGFQMGGALTDATPGSVGRLLTGLSDYLLDNLPSEFPVQVEVQLYENTGTTAKLVTAVESEIQAIAKEEQLKLGGNNE